MNNYVINNPADMLEAAASELEIHGWAQGAPINEYGQMCVYGALNRVGSNQNRKSYWSPAIDAMTFTTGEVFIASWNDRICSSQEQAVEMLRTAAKHWWEIQVPENENR
jgi:hypothetical protein